MPNSAYLQEFISVQVGLKQVGLKAGFFFDEAANSNP